MKIKKEIIQANYEILEINQEDFDTLKKGLNKGIECYLQNSRFYTWEIKGQEKEEMLKIQGLLNKIQSQ